MNEKGPDYKAGQEVFCPLLNHFTREWGIQSWTISKVGRKYIYLGGPGYEIKCHPDSDGDLNEVTDIGRNRTFYGSKKKAEDFITRCQCFDFIKKNMRCSDQFSTKQLVEIVRIMKEGLADG